MPRNIIASLVAATATLLPGAVIAQTAGMQHHTDPNTRVTLAEWTQRMQSELQRQMVAPTGVYDQLSEGAVRIKFNCSEDGRPSKVTLLKSSGRPAVDRAALRAVRSMASLHPLPTGFTPETRYEAIVLFANDTWDRRIALNDAERIKRNSWYHDPVSTPAQVQVLDR